MRCKAVYLEAAERTQDVLNLKWALLSAGYSIESAWHDATPHAISTTTSNWGERELAAVKKSHILVVLAAHGQAPTTRMATMLGFARAHNIQICWVGAAVEGIQGLHGIEHFKTADDFRRHLLRAGSLEDPAALRLAA